MQANLGKFFISNAVTTKCACQVVLGAGLFQMVRLILQ
jgi:hypothetical protein